MGEAKNSFICLIKKMAPKELHVEGYDALVKLIDGNADCKTDRLFVLFSGSIDAGTGASWCPDCVAADPVVAEALKDADDDLVLIHCAVGQRGFWKDQSNVFRTDPKLRLKGVPTLLNWHEPEKRLVEENLQKLSMVQLLLSED